jgi:GT2 family glycosyltransferase
MTSQVSVVIPCHSAARLPLITSSVASALAQDVSPAEVVIAVDNNRDLFNRLSETYSSSPYVSVVANTGPRGASATRNRGAAAARGEVIAFLDDDAAADPIWLGSLVDPLADPSVAGTGGGVRPRWQSGQPRWLPAEFLWTVGASFRGMPDTTAPVRNVWSENMAVRSSQFAAIGGFREGFGKHDEASAPEDTELCVRLANETGGRWMYVPSAQVEHYVPDTRTTAGFFLRRCHSEGRGKVEMKRLAGGRLSTEREYATRSIPVALRRQLAGVLRGDGTAALQLIATVAGCIAAATGAVGALLAPKSSTPSIRPRSGAGGSRAG